MATETLTAPPSTTERQAFADIPPFPDNIPTAPLLRLSLAKLLAKPEDGEESQRLFQASKELGFFYLDLRDTALGEGVLRDVDALFGVGRELFELEREEKQKYDFSGEGSYFGYKGYGQAITDKAGTRDRNEFYNVPSPSPFSLPSLPNHPYHLTLNLTTPLRQQISKNDILALSAPPPAPSLLTHTRPLFATFIPPAHTILSLLLTHLNTHLHLPPSTLPSLHRLRAPSGDQVRLLKAPAQDKGTEGPALGAHTDFGSLTLLFNRLGGLQVLLPEGMRGTEQAGKGGGWVYVRPLEGHAIVNVGDALSMFTGGLLRSNIHRVVAAPGAQRAVSKYSVVYFMRPEDAVVLKRLEGGDVIPALKEGEMEEAVASKDWVLRRALGRRVGGNVGNAWRGTEGTDAGRL
ncbi:hypothetical protein MMC30_007207 [Trapelia coarctata]|nr:hypothetical protein [Trapelia coarctata]